MKSIEEYITEKFKIGKKIVNDYFESGEYALPVIIDFGNKRYINLELFFPFEIIESNEQKIKYKTEEDNIVELNFEKREENIKFHGENKNGYYQINFDNAVSSIVIFLTPTQFFKFIKDIFPEFDIDEKYPNNPFEKKKINQNKLKNYFDIPEDKKLRAISCQNQYLKISDIYKNALKYEKN